MLDLWYRALHSELGISIECSDPEAVRKTLYKLRAKIQDVDLSNISINLSPFDHNKLWLVKNAAQGRQGDN